MKKKSYICLALAAVAGFWSLLITGCDEVSVEAYPSSNKMWYDNNNYFNRAIIILGNEVIEVEVEKWTDFEDGEQLQILAKDGSVYLTSSYNCTLIRTAQ